MQHRLLMIAGILLGLAVPLRAELDLAPVKAWIAQQAEVKSFIVDIKQERHLRTVKKPLESVGRFWFVQGGAFRWQAGDPPKVVALMNPKEEFSLIYPAKKTAEVFSQAAVEREDAGQGIAFLRAGFPASLEAFLERFEVLDLKGAEGWDNLEVKPIGPGASFAVRKLVMVLHQTTHRLGAMQVHLRDGSWVNNVFSGLQENAVIPASQFSYDLGGYEVKRR